MTASPNSFRTLHQPTALTELRPLAARHPGTVGSAIRAGLIRLCASFRGGGLALGLMSLATLRCMAALDDTTPTSAASGGTPSTIAAKRLGDDELLMDEVFQSHLPTTLEKYSLRLSVHPHLGDLENKDHLRMTTSLRYGLTDNCEISASSNLYFSHGRGDIGWFDSYGAASLNLGFKLDLGQHLLSGWETAVGAGYEFPTGHPPPELTDGLRHLRPYVTFSHRLESHPAVRIFIGFRLDEVSTTNLPGEFGKNAFRESSTGITGGWVIDRGNLHYTLEASFDTTRLITRTEEEIYSLRPGVIWEIPSRRYPGSKSHWTVGVALNDTFGPGGNSVGASFKLRYNRDLKNRFHRPPAP
jgi:hypothetical protein